MQFADLSFSGAFDALGKSLTSADRIALYLVSGTVVFAALVTYWQTYRNAGAPGGFLRHCVPRGILSHKSARADFLFWLSRRLFMPLLVIPLGLSTITAGYAAYILLSLIFGPTVHSGPASTLTLCAFTLSMVIAYDLSYYIYHYLCHTVPMLWELHKVHHSAQVMVGVTKDRVHPLDEILNRWWNGLIPGLVYGVWLFFALDPVELTVFGVSAYTIRNLLMMDVVRHTHLEMSYGRWLNRIFLCPYWHQLHHSIEPRHYNRNYGLLLSVWDEMFGTLAIPEPGEHFTFGLSNNEHDEYQSLARLHVVPLVKIWGLTSTWVSRNLHTGGSEPTGARRSLQDETLVSKPNVDSEGSNMSTITDVAIIGAGPYGLSLAAHLASEGVRFRIFGEPMQFWRSQMPEGMVLKSEGFASNLWHPDGTLTLQDYCAEHGLPYQDSGLPVPLQTFCDYGRAFQQRFVPMLDERSVTHVDRDCDGFVLHLQDGTSIEADRVVLATGIGRFPYTPPELDPIAGPLCSHSTDHRWLDRFTGEDVLVIGGGASGIELAGLMSEKGAFVTVATRQAHVPYCSPPRPRSLWERIQKPETGLGHGWRSWACVTLPMVFYRMPQRFRHLVVRKHLGPAPGWTSRKEVERNVTVLLSTNVISSSIQGGRAQVVLRAAGGTQRLVEADHVIAATGFKADMRRLSFLSPELMGKLETVDRTPVLSPWFETSVPGLFAVGAVAANCFGPLLRFAYGAGFASKRLSRHLARTAIPPA